MPPARPRWALVITAAAALVLVWLWATWSHAFSLHAARHGAHEAAGDQDEAPDPDEQDTPRGTHWPRAAPSPTRRTPAPSTAPSLDTSPPTVASTAEERRFLARQRMARLRPYRPRSSKAAVQEAWPRPPRADSDDRASSLSSSSGQRRVCVVVPITHAAVPSQTAFLQPLLTTLLGPHDHRGHAPPAPWVCGAGSAGPCLQCVVLAARTPRDAATLHKISVEPRTWGPASPPGWANNASAGERRAMVSLWLQDTARRIAVVAADVSPPGHAQRAEWRRVARAAAMRWWAADLARAGVRAALDPAAHAATAGFPPTRRAVAALEARITRPKVGGRAAEPALPAEDWARWVGAEATDVVVQGLLSLPTAPGGMAAWLRAMVGEGPGLVQCATVGADRVLDAGFDIVPGPGRGAQRRVFARRGAGVPATVFAATTHAPVTAASFGCLRIPKALPAEAWRSFGCAAPGPDAQGVPPPHTCCELGLDVPDSAAVTACVDRRHEARRRRHHAAAGRLFRTAAGIVRTMAAVPPGSVVPKDDPFAADAMQLLAVARAALDLDLLQADAVAAPVVPLNGTAPVAAPPVAELQQRNALLRTEFDVAGARPDTHHVEVLEGLMLSPEQRRRLRDGRGQTPPSDLRLFGDAAVVAQEDGDEDPAAATPAPPRTEEPAADAEEEGDGRPKAVATAPLLDVLLARGRATQAALAAAAATMLDQGRSDAAVAQWAAVNVPAGAVVTTVAHAALALGGGGSPETGPVLTAAMLATAAWGSEATAHPFTTARHTAPRQPILWTALHGVAFPAVLQAPDPSSLETGTEAVRRSGPPAVRVLWDTVCCRCCGFSSEIVHAAGPLQRLGVDVALLQPPPCFCQGYPAATQAFLTRAATTTGAWAAELEGQPPSASSAPALSPAAVTDARERLPLPLGPPLVNVGNVTPVKASRLLPDRLALAVTQRSASDEARNVAARLRHDRWAAGRESQMWVKRDGQWWQQARRPRSPPSPTPTSPPTSLSPRGAPGAPASSSKEKGGKEKEPPEPYEWGPRYAEGSEQVLVWISHASPDSYRNTIFAVRRPDVFIGRSMYEFTRLPATWAGIIASAVDVVWVPGEWSRKLFVANGVPRARVGLMPEGVDTALWNPAAVTPLHLPALDAPDTSTRAAGLFRFMEEVAAVGAAPRGATQRAAFEGLVAKVAGDAELQGLLGLRRDVVAPRTDIEALAMREAIERRRPPVLCTRPRRQGAQPRRVLSHFKWEPRKGWDVLLSATMAAFAADPDAAELVVITSGFAALEAFSAAGPMAEVAAWFAAQGRPPTVPPEDLGEPFLEAQAGFSNRSAPWGTAPHETATDPAGDVFDLDSRGDLGPGTGVDHDVGEAAFDAAEASLLGRWAKDKGGHGAAKGRRLEQAVQELADARAQAPAASPLALGLPVSWVHAGRPPQPPRVPTDRDASQAAVAGHVRHVLGGMSRAAGSSSGRTPWPLFPPGTALDSELVPRICIVTGHHSDLDLARLYRGADVFALATRGEGWGLPLLQAMAMGLPVVAPQWSGYTDFLTADTAFFTELDGLAEVGPRSFYGHAPGKRWAVLSAVDFARVLRYVVDHPGHAAAVGARARARAAAHFSEDAVAVGTRVQLQRMAAAFLSESEPFPPSDP